MTTTIVKQEDMIARYTRGQMDEPEKQRFEEAMILDADLADRVGVETLLIDFGKQERRRQRQKPKQHYIPWMMFGTRRLAAAAVGIAALGLTFFIGTTSVNQPLLEPSHLTPASFISMPRIRGTDAGSVAISADFSQPLMLSIPIAGGPAKDPVQYRVLLRDGAGVLLQELFTQPDSNGVAYFLLSEDLPQADYFLEVLRGQSSVARYTLTVDKPS